MATVLASQPASLSRLVAGAMSRMPEVHTMTTQLDGAIRPLTEVCDTSDRATWLKARRSGVGASDSPVLMGASHFSSAVELWGIKTQRLPESVDDENERMLWGQRLEPLVAEEYERRTGRQLMRWGWLLRSTIEPFMLATPDYHDLGGLPVEIKTTDASRKRDWTDGAPAHVNIQTQHQMFVTGASKASVGVLVGGNTFMWCDVERDDNLIAEIVATCRQFWNHVTSDQPPPADDSEATGAAIARMWPVTAEGEGIMLPEDSYDWARDLDKANADQKDAAGRIETVKNTIKLAIGSAEIGLFPDGSRAFSYKTQPRKGYTVAPSSSRVLRRING